MLRKLGELKIESKREVIEMGLKGLCIGLVLGIIIGIVNFLLKNYSHEKVRRSGTCPFKQEREC